MKNKLDLLLEIIDILEKKNQSTMPNDELIEEAITNNNDELVEFIKNDFEVLEEGTGILPVWYGSKGKRDIEHEFWLDAKGAGQNKKDNGPRIRIQTKEYGLFH